VPHALRAQGLQVETHADNFPEQETEAEEDDTRWLSAVGMKGWIILTKDKQISRNQVELVALYNSGAASFVLTSGQATGEAVAQSFISAIPAIEEIMKRFEPPFVASVTGSGAVRMLLTRSNVIKNLK
jgi:hypothetical protein